MKAIAILIAKAVFALVSMLMLAGSMIGEVLHLRNPLEMWRVCAPEIANIYKEFCEKINAEW